VTPEVPEALAVLARVATVLEDLQIRYHVGGSYAASVHGVPRQTQDIDLVVELAPDHIRDLVQALSRQFFIQESTARDAVQYRRSFNAIHLDSGLKVDFFVRGDEPYDLEEFKRHKPHPLFDDRVVPIKSPEDTVLRKLEWYRSGGEVSDRQWTDVLGILRTQTGTLDQAYLRKWATRLGIGDLLDRAVDEF
jgi:hypothetical protein